MTTPIPPIIESDHRRFWSKVEITANSDKCWNWTATKNNRGYGEISIRKGKHKRNKVKAHRFSYFLNYHVDPGSMLVCHTCDNPSCVNPRHLYLGSPKDNVADIVARNRYPSRIGVNNNASKLNESQILEIREKYNSGSFTQTLLAQQYNISQANIWRIIHRKKWNHL